MTLLNEEAAVYRTEDVKPSNAMTSFKRWGREEVNNINEMQFSSVPVEDNRC